MFRVLRVEGLLYSCSKRRGFKKKSPLQTEKMKAEKIGTSGMGRMNRDFTKYGSVMGGGHGFDWT